MHTLIFIRNYFLIQTISALNPLFFLNSAHFSTQSFYISIFHTPQYWVSGFSGSYVKYLMMHMLWTSKQIFILFLYLTGNTFIITLSSIKQKHITTLPGLGGVKPMLIGPHHQRYPMNMFCILFSSNLTARWGFPLQCSSALPKTPDISLHLLIPPYLSASFQTRHHLPSCFMKMKRLINIKSKIRLQCVQKKK